MQYLAIIAGGMFSWLYITKSNQPLWWAVATLCVSLVGYIKWPR